MKRIHLLFICFLFWTVFYASGSANASNEITRVWNGNIIIEAHDSALVEIFKELYDKFLIEVSGLEAEKVIRLPFPSKPTHWKPC